MRGISRWKNSRKDSLMLKKRIIPCLDIKDGKVVKGVQFNELRIAGDPVELGAKYAREGADELCFLDITATIEKRKTLAELAMRIAREINIPFTVGGGVKSVEDMYALLHNGADKITINSAAVRDPELISKGAKRFGKQCMVIAVDTKYVDGEHIVHLDGGRTPTEKRTLEWVKEAQERGAGEILLTSMDHDGTKAGFALELTQQVSETLRIPVIASGGGGTAKHFAAVLTVGKADAALAASIFHFDELPIPELKRQLIEREILIRTVV